MGAWGTAIFSDDTAADVRGDYRDHVGDGLSGPDATDRLLHEWRDTVDDPDEGPVFWLALAATQWACGRLEDRVKEKALAIIASDANLKSWADDPRQWAKRKAVLARLQAQLGSPPPPPKRIPRRFRNHCEWEVGELIGYQLRSGPWVLFRVIDHHVDKGGTSPIFEMLDWVGDAMPPPISLESLPVKAETWRPARGGGQTSKPEDRVQRLGRFMIGRTSERELPRDRVHRLGRKLPPVQRRPVPDSPLGRQRVWSISVFLWRDLDRSLKDFFDVG